MPDADLEEKTIDNLNIGEELMSRPKVVAMGEDAIDDTYNHE